MNTSIRWMFVFLCALLGVGCSTLDRGFDAKETSSEDYNRSAGDDRGGAQFETAIWSSDPNKKTLPKALGPDGQEK